MVRKAWIMLFSILFATIGLAASQPIVFILDASNSMNKPIDSKTRFDWAQEALITVVRELAEGVPFAIVAFGHRVPKDQVEASCRDIELLVPLRTYPLAERERIIARISQLRAMGKTPIANTLTSVGVMIPGGARLVLLTDGEETCGGDPLAAASYLGDRGYVLDVVAVSISPEVQTVLAGLAQGTGGQFVVIQDPRELPALFREVVVAPVAPTPAIPELLKKYRVDSAIVALLVEHLPYDVCDSMWDVILRFLEKNPPAKVIVGMEGDDVLFGTSGNDLILGLGGNDQIYGFAGNDLLIGGPSNDLIQGGEGDDLILGGPGNDRLLGGPGNDIIYGGPGDDVLEGEAGDDCLYGGEGNDRLLGGPGCNVLDGGPGQNFIHDEGFCPPVKPIPTPPTVVLVPPILPPLPVPCPPPAPSPPVIPEPKVMKTVNEGESIVLQAWVYDPDDEPVTVTWSAPKGSFSDPHAIETVYTAPKVISCEGEYVVITLTAVDACGAKTQDQIMIHVLNVNRPPVVDAGPDLVVDEGSQIQILATASDPDGDPLTYRWIIESGRGLLNNPNVLQPIYTAPYTFLCEGEDVILTLIVRDACGAEAKDTVKIHVRNVNRPPWVNAGPDLDVPEGGQIMIFARAGDPDSEPLTVVWQAEQGSFINPESLTPIFVAPLVSVCDFVPVRVTVQVTDPCGATVTDTIIIRVHNINRPPEVRIDP